MKRYDVIVIGGGPAGYAAAIRAAQLGMNVACIDERMDADGRPALGGTCLNVGCIPSKVLLEASAIYDLTRRRYPQWGILTGEIGLDLGAMMAHKQAVVDRMTQGIATLFQANGVRSLSGRGRLLPNREVEFTPADGSEPTTLSADHVVLAAGSRPVEIGAAPLHGDIIVDSTGALGFREVPARLGVIGAGVIGLELGSVWRRLGAEVVLLEAQQEFLNVCDRQIAREALRSFRAQGLDVRLGSRVTGCTVADGVVDLEYQDEQGQTRTERFDRLIVAVGRQSNTDGLCASEAGLLLDEWGFVHVDRHCLTNLPGVHAVGDLVRGPMLAHKGAEEGVMVIERIAGREAAVNYDTIPSVIYTLPEIAWAGATEQGLIATGTAYRSGTFPFAANGRAHAYGETEGMVKVLADATTDRVLGVHMIGPGCSELIATAVVAMEFGASSEDLALTVFAHPTLSEALHEAALGVHGRAIHIAKKK
ncbi:MAG: dihydrolipoyl dehydrogenase [Gammaproteobacteria bacterium]|jgi:dihydrolipoamide dehydrogenase|nr:dihydrolipoyl dehydrogenase [Gammaproteobacteria bacterium]